MRKLHFVPTLHNFVKFKFAYPTFVLLLLLIEASSMAASLGRHTGAALIGRPLDISVQAVMDVQEDIANLCLDADVFYADNRLDKSRVRVTAEKASNGPVDTVIRIRAAVPVNEPVVTIYVRVGCQQRIERRYVTLADMPSEAVADRNAAEFGRPPGQVFPLDTVLPALASTTAQRADAKSVQKNRNTPTSREARDIRNIRPSPNSQGSVAAGSPVVTPDTTKVGNLKEVRKGAGTKQLRAGAAIATGKSAAANGSRLKLEPLDLSVEREPQLRSSSRLFSLPSANLQERSAAAALWRAITSPPQDILRDFDKLQNLESSVRSLQLQNQKSQKSIQELGVKLQQAESERYANALVYALGFLLVLAIATLAYILQKQSVQSDDDGSTPWWRRRDKSQRLLKDWTDSGAHPDDFDPKSAGKKQRSEVTVKAGLANHEVDPDALNFGSKPSKLPSGFHTDSLPPLGSPYPGDFALSMTHPSRAVKAEELFDVNQQADFFVSIGQHEQAIEVLRNHINDDVETSVLVYLDLFNLYHQLARKDDYAALRENFNGHFNIKIPVFELYTFAGPGLEAYQLAMSRIEALWPSPKVLEVIEESIFKRPENDAEAFNLTAYRELLILYSVAKEIISYDIKATSTSVEAGQAGMSSQSRKFELPATSADRTDSQPIEFVHTSIQPLSASIQDGNIAKSGSLMNPLSKSTPTSAVSAALSGLYLDIDLSQPMPAREKRVSNAAVNTATTGSQMRAESRVRDSSSLRTIHTHSAENLPESPGNLIAFDAFDGFESALNESEKPKPPRV